MKNIISIFILQFLVCITNAQTILITSNDYHNLKTKGELNPHINYKLINNSLPINQIDQHPKINRSISGKSSSSNNCECLIPWDNSFSIVPMIGGAPPFYRQDDGFSDSIQLGFNFCFYGTTYTKCYINNNGNISFDSPYNTFSSNPFPDPSFVMIAPFWGDVDTSTPLGGLVYFKQTPTALIVKWHDVGYFPGQLDKINDFQLIITDGTDPILPNGNNIAFCYGDMQWTTGAASLGIGGFGGVPATVGVNKGDGINFIQIGRFDTTGISYDGPYGQNDGISFLDNKSYYFNSCGTNNNLPPIIQDATGGAVGCNDTIRICAHGDTLVYSTSFLAPENNQSITVNGSAPSLGGSFIPLNTTTSSAGVTTYNWMVVASTSVTGVHQITVTGTDNGTPPLSSTTFYNIKIENISIPQPTISINPSSGIICASSGASVTVTNCSDYDNVFWSNGSSGCNTITNTSGIIYTTVNKLGCYKTTSNTITIVPNPIPVISGYLNYCPPATSTTLSLNLPTTGMPAYSTYTWSAPIVNTATAAISSGVSTLAVTDINGCSSSITFTVTTGNPSVNIIANPISICGTNSSTLTSSIIGATSYSWTNGATTQSTSVSMGGIYGLTVTANNCVSTQTIDIATSATPTVTLPSSITLCAGTNTLVSPLTINPSGAYSYTWSNGSNASSSFINTTTNLNLQVTDNSTGCVSLLSNTCSIVVVSNPTITFPLNNGIFCNNSNAALTPSVLGGTPSYSYSWTPSILGTAPSATTNIVGNYTISVTDQNQCKGTATVSTLKSTPTVSLTSPDLIICPGDCTTLNALGTSSFTPYIYSWLGSSVTSSTLLACSAGTYTISFTDAVGCADANTITVINDIVPIASFTANPSSPVSISQPITFANTSSITSGSITTSNWTFGDGNGTSTSNPTHSYEGTGSYPITLIVTASNGCKDTATISYEVTAILNIPNVITPNGDNANDYLKFNNLQLYGTNSLTIFNRWGKKIFEQENYKNDWNGGNYNDGTYFFILNVPEATPNSYNGYFQIIK